LSSSWNVPTPPLTGLRCQGQIFLWKKPLMQEFFGSLRILFFHSIIQKHTIVASGQITIVKLSYRLDLNL
jgi:hypothetical protein